MPPDIRVPIPQPGEDLRLYFDEGVENDQFGFALDFSVSEFGARARMTDIWVTAAEATPDGVVVHYTITWEALQVSDGKTISGDAARIVRGQTDGADWLFTTALPPTKRAALNES